SVLRSIGLGPITNWPLVFPRAVPTPQRLSLRAVLATKLKLGSSGMISRTPMSAASRRSMTEAFELCFQSPRVLFSAQKGDSTANENNDGQQLGAGGAGLRLCVCPESAARRA